VKYCITAVDDRFADDIQTMHEKLFDGKRLKKSEIETGYWWLITHNNKPAGFAGLHHSNKYIDCGYLCRVGVTWPHQGQGLQKRLIRVREKKARILGWNWLVTDTTPENLASSNSLISCGFKLYSPCNKWAFKRSLYWRKELE